MVPDEPAPALPQPAPPTPSSLQGQAEVSNVAPATDTNANEEPSLDEKTLELLGDAPKLETELGKPIHKDIAARWQEILNKGLDKETKEKLLKEYLVPSNCDRLLAPVLNPEIKAALPETLIKRDIGMTAKQKQIGIAIAALSNAVEVIISKEITPEKLLKPISDACRILCDTHFTDTKTRRGFVLSAINNNLKETVTESGRSKLLFGDDIAEKLKSAKSIQKSGEVLKQTPKSSVFNKANFVATNKNNRGRLNYKNLHRKQAATTNRFDAGKPRSAGRATRSSDYPPAPPPPPPPPPPYPAQRASTSRRRQYN